MESKLTLKLNDNSIARAKEYVAQKKISLSSIVENFFDGLTLNKKSSDFEYSPLVNELAGVIHLDENYDFSTTDPGVAAGDLCFLPITRNTSTNILRTLSSTMPKISVIVARSHRLSLIRCGASFPL